jgi:hypothetical protein
MRGQHPDRATWPIATLTSAFCPDFEPQTLAMAICAAYLEPIETPEQADTYTVIGLVSSKARWREFETRWSRILRRDNLSTFNAADYSQFRGDFATGWDSGRRRGLVDELGRLAQVSILHAFSSSIRLEDYRSTQEEDQSTRSEAGIGLYALCAGVLIADIRRWMRAKHPRELTLFILREGDLHGQELRQVLKCEHAEQGEPAQFWPAHWLDECGRNRYLRPLEACELLAAARSGMFANRLIERGQLDRQHVDRERLSRICESLRALRRSPAEAPAQKARIEAPTPAA